MFARPSEISIPLSSCHVKPSYVRIILVEKRKLNVIYDGRSNDNHDGVFSTHVRLIFDYTSPKTNLNKTILLRILKIRIQLFLEILISSISTDQD